MSNTGHIRQELNKLAMLPPWGRPQSDNWDTLSDFIYDARSVDDLRIKVRDTVKANDLDAKAFGAYVVRRWYNHHTHQEIMEIICGHPSVKPEQNERHRTIDFYLRDIPFDLKISRFPQAYPGSVGYAKANPAHLVNWLYSNQSRERRFHVGNRLFIILLSPNDEAQVWRLRRNFSQLESLIWGFFDSPHIIGAQTTDQDGQIRLPWAGVIYCTATE